MKRKLNLNIFSKTINNKNKLIYFKNKSNKFIYPKYSPAYFNEWKNSIYLFNKNNTKNFPNKILNINELIKSYFNLYFQNNNFIKSKYIQKKKMRYFLRKIYISKIGIKHTNSKAIISIFTINIGKDIFNKKYKSIENLYKEKNYNIQNFFWKGRLNFLTKLFEGFNYYNNIQNYCGLNLNNIIKNKYFLLKNFFLLLTINKISKIWSKRLRLFRKYYYLYSLNQFKYNNKLFLSKLSNKLSKSFNKKIEFNLINIKSIVYSPDIFTQILALKLSKRIKTRQKRANVYRNMKILLYKGKMPIVNRILETRKFDKTITKNFLQNQYNNFLLSNILKGKNLNKLLDNIYYNYNFVKKSSLNFWLKRKETKTLQNKRNNIIFNSIKYKNLGGMKLEVKGRLTKRYRADRSIHKIFYKGRFNNIESSYKNLPSVVFRGHINNNSAYSLYKSKRRIGAFAVKGWISGK
jgi:hypothetical protein